uniref:VWFA domain-containing protein n=1 Tax=Hucho hucho TaxID=62062 RepID=A0A4W5NV26_9TELE
MTTRSSKIKGKVSGFHSFINSSMYYLIHSCIHSLTCNPLHPVSLPTTSLSPPSSPIVLICPVEIMFILDSSEKAKVLLFEKQKDFVLRFSTRLMQIQAAGWRLRLRLAALQYSSSVSLEHNFRDWQDVDVFQSRVASMAYIGHGTYSAYAITNATQMFSRETAANSLRVMLLMTDGVDHPRSPSAVTAASEAKNHNIRLFTIGLSGLPRDMPTNARLRSIASAPPQQHVLSLADNLLEDKLFRELNVLVNTGVSMSLFLVTIHLECKDDYL